MGIVALGQHNCVMSKSSDVAAAGIVVVFDTVHSNRDVASAMTDSSACHVCVS